ncbi:hypothetical protein HAX54_017799, partial [Datura stramonium]|nr:hypothetical protein [Datura stramonium]
FWIIDHQLFAGRIPVKHREMWFELILASVHCLDPASHRCFTNHITSVLRSVL